MAYSVLLIIVSSTIQVFSLYCNLSIPKSTLTLKTFLTVTCFTDILDASLIKIECSQGSYNSLFSVRQVMNGQATTDFSLDRLGDWSIRATCDGGKTYSLASMINIINIPSKAIFETIPKTINTYYKLNVQLTPSGQLDTQNSSFTCSIVIENATGNNMQSNVVNSFIPSEGNIICSYDINYSAHMFYRVKLEVIEKNSGISLYLDAADVFLDKIDSLSIDPLTNHISVHAFENVEYKINLKDASSNPFTGTCTVSLSINDASTLGGIISKQNSLGSISFTVFYPVTGTVTLIVTAVAANTLTVSQVLNVKALHFSINAQKIDFNLPTTSNDLFEISIQVLNDQNMLSSVNLPTIPFTLELKAASVGNSGLVLMYNFEIYTSGVLSGKVSGGKFIYSGCQILSSGSFSLGVSSSFSPTITPASINLNIENYIKSISADPNNISPYAYAYFSFSIRLIGSDNNLFLGSRSITLSGAYLKSNSTTVSLNGYATWHSLSMANSEELNLILSKDLLDSYNTSISITIQTGTLTIEFSSNPPTTSDLFDTVVKYIDKMNNIISVHNQFVVKFSLNAKEPGNSGLIIVPEYQPVIILEGQLNLKLKILSSGKFVILPSTVGIRSKESSIVNIVNKVRYINISTQYGPLSVYYKNILLIRVIGEDSTFYKLETTINLGGDSTLVGTPSVTGIPFEEGLLNMTNVVFKSAGDVSIYAYLKSDPGISTTSHFTVYQCRMFVEAKPTNYFVIFEPFTIKIKIFDYTVRYPVVGYTLSVTLSLSQNDIDSSSYLYPKSPSNTTNTGVAIFTELRISSNGTFYLRSSNPNFVDTIYGPPLIVRNRIYSIKISNELINTSTYSIFALNGNLMESASNLLMGLVQIVLSDSTLNGSSLEGVKDLTVSTGTFTFNSIYFTTSGNKTITITSIPDGVIATKLVNVVMSTFKVTLSTSMLSYFVPQTSMDVFEYVVKVVDPTGSYLRVQESDLKLLNFTLSLVALGPVSGLVTDPRVLNGVIYGLHVFPIRILSSGNFTMKASSPNFEDGFLDRTLTIKNSVKLANITYTSTLSAYETFDVSILLIGDDDENYILPATVSLSSSTPFIDMSTNSTIITSGTMKIYTKNPGEQNFQVKVKDSTDHVFTSNDLSISVLKAKLEIKLDPMPEDTTDIFTIIIKIKTNSGEKYLTPTDPINVSLVFDCEDCFSPKLPSSIVLINGEVNITGYKITLIGNRTLTVEGADMVAGSVQTQNLIWGVKSLALNLSNIESSADGNINASMIITDQNDKPFAGKCRFMFFDNFNVTLNNSPIITTGSNPVLNIFFINSNATFIKIICKEATPIAKLSIMAAKFTTQSSSYYTNQSVIVNVTVINLISNKVGNSSVAYLIDLVVSPELDLNLTSSITISGKSSVEMKFRRPGVYIVTGKPHQELSMIPSKSILIIEDLPQIEYNKSSLLNFRNTLIQFNVTLLDYYGDLFKYTTDLKFACLDVYDVRIYNPIQTTTTAKASFTFYFLSGGTKNCSITSNTSTSINVIFSISYQRLNSNQQCIAAVTDKVCYVCVPQAILKEGSCSCAQESYFSEYNNMCICNKGLTFMNEKCMVCGNYFNNNELSGYFAEDYRSIIIKFGRPAEQVYFESCKHLVNLPESYKNFSFKCYWDDPFTLKVYFNAIVPGEVSNIKLNEKYVQAAGSLCLYNTSSLMVVVQQKYSKPLPQVLINGPASISIKCAFAGLTIKSKYVSSDYIYQWNVRSSNEKLVKEISNISLPSFTIPKSLLKVEDLTFNLKITIRALETSNSVNFVVKVVEAEHFIVAITVGPFITRYALDPLLLKTSIADNCGLNGNFTYSWDYSSNPPDKSFDFVKFTNSQENSAYLSIEKGALKKNTKYVFSVTVRSGSISGSYSTSVNVIPHDLIITLDRSSGTVSLAYNLLITATAVDPDNECDLIKISWKCTEFTNSCTDSNGDKIPKVEGSQLLIDKSKLKSGAFYKFQATATCELKANSVFQAINILVNSTALISIKYSGLDQISSNQDLIINPDITAPYDVQFLWTIDPYIYFYYRNEPQLYIPAGYLEPGIVYQIMLIIYTTDISDGISSYTNIHIKPSPICSNFTISSNGNSKYRFSISCENDDPAV